MNKRNIIMLQKIKISKHIVYILLFSICFLHNIYAKSDITKLIKEEKHHIILLIDRSGSMDSKSGRKVLNKTEKKKRQESLKKIIEKDLKNLLFKEGAVLENRLLFKSYVDYISILGFGIPAESPSFNNFIHKDFSYEYNTLFSDRDLEKVWNKIDNNYYKSPQYFRMNWSAYSVAMEMALANLTINKPVVHRTFIITLSDGEFNAIHPSLELEELEKAGISGIDKVKQIYNKITNGYEVIKLDKKKTRDHIKLNVFEVKPRVVNTFESVVDLDNFKSIKFSRSRDGFYMCDFVVGKKISDNKSCYKPIAISYSIYDSTSNKTKEYPLKSYGDSTRIRCTLNKELNNKQGLKLSLNLFSNYDDQNYGAHIVKLTHELSVQFESQKKILWIIPIWNGLFNFHQNYTPIKTQDSIKYFWNILLATFFFLVLINKLVNHLKQKPADEHILLSLVESKN